MGESHPLSEVRMRLTPALAGRLIDHLLINQLRKRAVMLDH